MPNEITKPGDYRDIIAAVAKVKDVDLAKLERLMQLQEQWEQKRAAEHFNEQMALAQGEMRTVSTDSANPLFRSRYASLAGVDNAIRPIYTKYGFSVTFDEHETERGDGLLLIAMVSCGAETRKYRKWIPISSQGLRGREATTPTHAAIGAVTYGRRTLLKMIFNLAEEDTDGNFDRNAADRKPAGPKSANNDAAERDALDELIGAGQAPTDWAGDMILEMRNCKDAAEYDAIRERFKLHYRNGSEPDKERIRAEHGRLIERLAARKPEDDNFEAASKPLV